MKNKKYTKTFIAILVAGLLFQSGILAYAGLFGNDADDVGISQVIVSDEIQNIIKNQEPTEFNKNLTNYKKMIVLLNVHDVFKEEIERLITEGKKLTDIMIAYTYLNDCYGTMDQVSKFLDQRASGQSWQDIFEQYEAENPAFVPTNFDFDYLDSLTKNKDITADDIMIADRVSQKAGMPFEEVIDERISGRSWKDINASLNIINGQDSILRVPVTSEQLNKYVSGDSFNEERVVEILVIVCKLGLDEKEAIEKAKAGYTNARFFSEALVKKFD